MRLNNIDNKQNFCQMDIIEIYWKGPFTLNDVISRNEDGTDYGVYQIYGTHNINGSNTLLYIGKAQEQTFGKRILQHQSWMDNELSDMQIYIGKFGGIKQIDDQKWSAYIDVAEKLLIYYCSPPYNSSNINDFGKIKETVVLNFGKKCQLPFEVSTLYWESKFWNMKNWQKSNEWQEYIEK